MGKEKQKKTKKKIMLTDFLSNNGWTVIKNDFEFDNQGDITFNSSVYFEDILQASKNDFVIDVGWYDNEEAYICYLIEKLNWDKPVQKVKIKSEKELLKLIQSWILKIK